MKAFLVMCFVLSVATALGSEGQDAPPVVQSRLTLAEAEKRVRAYIFQVKPKMNPTAEFPLKEILLEGLFERLGIQVFQVTSGSGQTFQSYLIYRGEVRPFGVGFGGWGVMSMCLADLDGDGKEELVYTYSWGSGLHRSHVAVLKVADAKLLDAQVPFVFSDGDLFVRKLEGGQVRVEAGKYNRIVNEWVASATVGNLKTSKENDELELDVELVEPLPKEIRDAIWKKK